MLLVGQSEQNLLLVIGELYHKLIRSIVRNIIISLEKRMSITLIGQRPFSFVPRTFMLPAIPKQIMQSLYVCWIIC